MSKAERLLQQTNPEAFLYADVEHLTYEEFVNTLGQRIKKALCPVGEAYLDSPQKRMLDVIGSIALMPLATSIIVGAAAAIRLEGGPIFAVIQVPGKHKEEFDMIKLRTMRSSSQSTEKSTASEPLLIKEQGDSRITRVGKILRKWTIDELPQFINVLRGEMSLVGNRPMFKDRINYLGTVDKLSDLLPKWLQIYNIAKPGMAGLATSRGRGLLDQSTEGLRRRLRYETFYVTHASLGFDLQIIFETMKAVLSRRGAF